LIAPLDIEKNRRLLEDDRNYDRKSGDHLFHDRETHFAPGEKILEKENGWIGPP